VKDDEPAVMNAAGNLPWNSKLTARPYCEADEAFPPKSLSTSTPSGIQSYVSPIALASAARHCG